MVRQRLLLAHENADCLKIYRSVLDFDGYEVVVTDNGDSALAALVDGTFDLVIADLYLRSTEDECFVRRMRRHAAGAHLPLIVLTAWSTAPHRRLALDEGADLFFSLPVGPRQLVNAVHDMLGDRRPAGLAWSVSAPGSERAPPPPL